MSEYSENAENLPAPKSKTVAIKLDLLFNIIIADREYFGDEFVPIVDKVEYGVLTGFIDQVGEFADRIPSNDVGLMITKAAFGRIHAKLQSLIGDRPK